MKIGIANDHRGYAMKQLLKVYLEKIGYEVINYGTDSEDPANYPEYAFIVGEAIRDERIDFGILICGTGIGMSIACNKVDKVRCARIVNSEDARLTRIDNNSNVASISYNMDTEEAKNAIYAFLNTNFSDSERHHKRVSMIDQYKNEH